MRRFLLFILVFVLVLSGCGKSVPGGKLLTEENVPVIPRNIVLFRNKGEPKISPDGNKIAWMAVSEKYTNVWVSDIDKTYNAKPVTNTKDGPVFSFEWDYSNNIVYYKDTNGDENYHLYRVDLAKHTEKDLTPGKDLKASILTFSQKYPKEIAILVNDRDNQRNDVKKINLDNGKTELLYKNVDKIEAIVDSDFKIRLGTRYTPDGGKELLRYKNNKWDIVEKVTSEDEKTTHLFGIAKNNKYVYMIDGLGRDTSAVYKVDIDTWDKQLIAEDPKVEASEWIFWSKTDEVAAVCFDYERQNWKVVDPAVKPDIDYLSTFKNGHFFVKSQTPDDRKWIVMFESDTESDQYYIYDTWARYAKPLFENNSNLAKFHLSKMLPRVIKSKDGLDLVCYLSLPPWSDNDNDGIPDFPLPMVINVHGGPASRVNWGYNGLHQFLANRGYAVLSVNFRGSYGFGKKFLNWGNGEWGGRMQEDINDTMDWAIAQKIAIPAKVCIYGGSYGGYAALAGIAFTPERFACAVDIVGISNLTTFLRSIPPYWKPYYRSMIKQVGGDPDTEAGKIFLKSRSPINYVDMIQRPLLIAHGFNDARVKVAESEEIVKAMQEKGIPVVYCLYSDEGHGFKRWQNSQSFYAIVEDFLAKNLGGRVQKMKAVDFEGSSIDVKAGKQYFEGLEELLPLQPLNSIKNR